MNMSSIDQVLVISPEADHHQKISGAVERCGLGSIYCKEFVEARSFLARQKFRVVFCHDTLPDGDFRGVIAAVNPTPVVVLSRFAEWDHYLTALRAGAFDYLACPPAAGNRTSQPQAAIDRQNLQNGTNAQTKPALVGVS